MHFLASPRECMEAAADLAAFFSDWRADWRQCPEGVEVMYTDSRHVAKRGARVGQMKVSKKLGTIFAQPWRAKDDAQAAQQEQGFI